MLSNASNNSRLKEQLKHDSEQKEKDRLHALRKEVYLKAVEEAAKVGGYLGRIPQMDPTVVNIGDGLSDFFAASAKLQLVSQPETASLVSELTVRYGEILFLLLQKASPIHSLNAEIKITGTFYDRNQADVERIIAEMRQINESGKHDEKRFSALETSYENSQKLAKHFAEKREKAFDSHEKALDEFTATLMEQMKSVISLQYDVMQSARRELNLSLISERNETPEINFKRLSLSMDNLINYLRNKNH